MTNVLHVCRCKVFMFVGVDKVNVGVDKVNVGVDKVNVGVDKVNVGRFS